MRYLRTQVLNRRAPFDQRLQVDLTNGVVMKTPNNLLLPKGTTADRPVAPLDGMIRYNTTLDQVEMYQAGTWRSFKFKEASPIIQQNLGSGDAINEYFGPLNASYDPTNVSSDFPGSGGAGAGQYGGQNLLVIVENVIQLNDTNYTVVQNPTIPGQSYAGDTASITTIGSVVVTFDVTTLPIYPSVDIVGAGLSGDPSIQSSTLITAYTVDSENRLTSVTIDKPTITADMPAGTVLTITDLANVASGYYLKFTSAVPYGKPVTVLHGFDQ